MIKLNLQDDLLKYVGLQAQAFGLSLSEAVTMMIQDHLDKTTENALANDPEAQKAMRKKVWAMRASGLSWREIGKTFGLSGSTVYSRCVRAPLRAYMRQAKLGEV